MTMPAHHFWAANTDVSISVSPLKPPHLLWIVAPRWKTAKAAGFTMQLWDQHCFRLFVIEWPYKAIGETVRSDVERTFVLGTLWLGYITVIYNWLFIAVGTNGNLPKQSLEMSHWIIKAVNEKWKECDMLRTTLEYSLKKYSKYSYSTNI